METQMKDMFGVDLAIGDRVIVITSRHGHSIKVRKRTLSTKQKLWAQVLKSNKCSL